MDVAELTSMIAGGRHMPTQYPGLVETEANDVGVRQQK